MHRTIHARRLMPAGFFVGCFRSDREHVGVVLTPALTARETR
jgi:hypothetical protein